jgi:hypothetical protein
MVWIASRLARDANARNVSGVHLDIFDYADGTEFDLMVRKRRTAELLATTGLPRPRPRPPEPRMTHLGLIGAERDQVLAALFELTITYVEDDEKRERCKMLAARLGRDSDAMFFGALPPELRR